MNMKKRVFFGLTVVVCLAVAAWQTPDENLTAKAIKSITIPELRDHMFYLASDELGGRQPGTQGYHDAVLYGATQFRQAGLKPIIKDSEENLTYMQSFNMVRTSKPDTNTLTVHRGDETVELKHGTDFGFLSVGKNKEGEKVEGLEFVYVGYGISEPDHGWNDYEGLEVEGKIIIMQVGTPMKDDKPVLPENINKRYTGGQRGMMPKMMKAMSMKPAGVFIAPSDVGVDIPWERIVGMMSRPTLSAENTPGAMGMLAMIQVPLGLITEKTVNAIMADAPYNPASEEGEYQTFAIEGVTADLVTEVKNETFVTNNVVGVVEGTDPELKNEYITVGAHIDHEGVQAGEIFNGADDNASGSVSVMELAEAMAMNPPRRSVIFVLYSAEESGLIGSNYFVQNSPVPVENIVLNINLDMVGRETEEVPGGVQAIGSSKRSTQLKNIVAACGEKMEGLTIDFSIDENDPENFFGRSDQVHFHQKGIPVVFFTTGEHPQYHRPTDDAELIDFEKLQKVTQLSFYVAQEVGNLDARLVQDVEQK